MQGGSGLGAVPYTGDTLAFPEDLDPSRPGPHDELKLAFAVWVAKLIADADGVLDLAEIRLLTRRFPNDLLRSMGLMDEQGDYTPRYHDARIEAAHQLRRALPLEERLELVTIFHELCMADDVLEQAELLVLREAAEALGIDVRQLSRHLRDLKG